MCLSDDLSVTAIGEHSEHEIHRSHGEHVTVRNLRGGYAPQQDRLFEQAIRELESEGPVHTLPARTGRGTDKHVVAAINRLPDACALMNLYRRSIKLKPLRPDQEVFSRRKPLAKQDAP
jgi:hypothetical protein